MVFFATLQIILRFCIEKGQKVSYVLIFILIFAIPLPKNKQAARLDSELRRLVLYLLIIA